MGDRDALLPAICESPDEDTPRLAFADLIEGHGEPDRAAFIRAQIQLERTEPDTRGRAALVKHKNELLRRHGDVWAAEVGTRGVSEVQFRRGFVDAVTVTAHALLAVPDLHDRGPGPAWWGELRQPLGSNTRPDRHNVFRTAHWDVAPRLVSGGGGRSWGGPERVQNPLRAPRAGSFGRCTSCPRHAHTALAGSVFLARTARRLAANTASRRV